MFWEQNHKHVKTMVFTHFNFAVWSQFSQKENLSHSNNQLSENIHHNSLFLNQSVLLAGALNKKSKQIFLVLCLFRR